MDLNPCLYTSTTAKLRTAVMCVARRPRYIFGMIQQYSTCLYYMLLLEASVGRVTCDTPTVP